MAARARLTTTHSAGFAVHAFLLAALLTACGDNRAPAPTLDVVDATLTTSDGQYAFQARSFYTDPDRETYNLSLLAEAPGINVWVAPFGLTGQLQVWTESEGRRVEFVPDNAFYEADYQNQQLLHAFEDEAYDRDGRPMATLTYAVPDDLTGLLYTMSGRVVFSEDAAERIRNSEDTVHRFYFEFAVDGRPYVADVAVRLDVVMDTTEGVP